MPDRTIDARTGPALDPVPLTQRLVRYDTTNPPGDEAACVGYVESIAAGAGLETRVIAADPRRPNLLVRLPGRGDAPPLLLHAHVDVVPTGGQRWTHPPFDGALRDGHVWGRGSLDMKGGLAMMLTAMLRLRAADTPPAGDVLLAVVPDEEAGSAVGAGHLVREHPGLFAGVRHAVGEDGGADLDLGGTVRPHPVVVAEKRACWLRVTLRGPGGHSSRTAPPTSAVRQLTRLLRAIEPGGLEPVVTPAVDRMLRELAAVLDEPLAGAFARLRTDPGDEDALNALPEADAQYLRSVLRPSVNATVIEGGTAPNVLPDEISVTLDGRALPGGFGAADFVAELSARTGTELSAEVLVEGEAMPGPEFGTFYDDLVSVLRAADPDGLPVPMMTTASTDARLFRGLGIACYGWLPLLLPAGTGYRGLLHRPDERVPAEALRFGASCFTDLLRGYR
ncbi:M20/M25/M40 family metallo-hydrolase [Actinomadura macra]|uniref:M20/M25/M40 family metallo-hydrolase n=1 Tax=Actinomadura macra TaxID=46164 RepID=UPI000A8BCEDE|nr:M20/M25/M40 family metallo-hydrolase [Actinomadura macra]